MKVSNEQLKSALVSPGHISEDDFTRAVVKAHDTGVPLDDVLVDDDLISDQNLGKLIAELNNFHFRDLTYEKIDRLVFFRIPEMVARSHNVAAINETKEGVRVGMLNPNDMEMRHVIEKRLGAKVIPYYVTRRGLDSVFSFYTVDLQNTFDKILKKLKNPTLTRSKRNRATIEMVDILMVYGYQNKASDIHIEPFSKQLKVRFRIDGIMYDVLTIPKNVYDLILTRLKILAKMRTDEHRAAQDGKFRFFIKDITTFEGSDVLVSNRLKNQDTKLLGNIQQIVDVRVSIVPITEGENVVMRLLSSKGRQFGLSTLGLLEHDFEKIRRSIKKPHGMILAVGPTGSGKTTSMYAILKILNTREVHIASIEDPVEYDVEGISQIQVNLQTNLTFAKGLRAIVRQDPDIIFVGEIRDEETAGIAVNSAMTGHMVLSTLHTNDAATTLPRLLDMEVEPFLIASTINVIVAQRLLRKICIQCRESISLTDKEKSILQYEPKVKKLFAKLGHKSMDKLLVYRGAGCRACGDTGYVGRIGVFEILEMDEHIKKMILRRASSDEIAKQAIKNGMSTLLEDGLRKVLNGVTTLEEVLRVTKT